MNTHTLTVFCTRDSNTCTGPCYCDSYEQRTCVLAAQAFRLRGLILAAFFGWTFGFALSALGSQDQFAAMAMLDSAGGKVTISASGEIVQVDLRGAWVTDADLELLSTLSYLEALDLGYTKITDRGLEQLAPLQNLKTLNLRYAEYISDAGIAHLKHWRKLVHLNLRGTKVTSTVFEHVSQMRQLKFLDVAHSRVSDELFEELADLDQLESFSFGGNKMSGVALPLLKLFPSLRELDIGTSQRTDSGLWSVSVTDSNIQSIAELTHLEVLRLNRTAISDRGIAQLSRLTNLHTLDLSGTSISYVGVESLSGLPKLGRLNLSRADRIDDTAIAKLQNLRQIETLDLTLTKVSHTQLMELAKLPRLKKLFIGGLDLPSEQAGKLRAALPGCDISWWSEP